MISAVYLNMPVADVARSREFFTQLDFTVKEEFSGPDNVCMIIAPSVAVMLMNHEKFKGFTNKETAPKNSSEVILSFACDSAEAVRSLSEKAISLGARKINEPDDNDFMFSWGFEDLDGHLWDLFWMKP
jgi:hypothetical protein